MLEEGICDHRHERMTVKALPGSSLEVIETEFFFQLLVSLLANPSRLDGGRQGAQVRLRRQVGEIVFLLSGHPVFADEPGLPPPGRCCWPLSLIRCGGPSAMRTRMAAKRALSFPFVPVRQLMFCHDRPACLRPLSIECQERAAYGDGRARQSARSSAHRQGTP